MVVSWNENPTPSSARTIRLERQALSATSRSVPVTSSAVRTIIGVQLLSSGQGRRDGVGDDVHAVLQVVARGGQRGQQFDDLVGGSAGLHQYTAVERRATDGAGRVGLLETQPLGHPPAPGAHPVVLLRALGD